MQAERLSITRGIAHAHGGDVSVERVSNVGARFVLRLPIASDARPGAPAAGALPVGP